MPEVKKHIFLVGFMGSGKSTIGRLLAVRMKRAGYDLDELIEKGEGRSITEIFAAEGEAFFRRLESGYLLETRNWEPSVIALGGGTFVGESNRAFMAETGLSVWLKIPLTTALERCQANDRRPLAKDTSEWESLFNLRERSYQLADVHIDTGEGTPEQICEEILKTVRTKGFTGQ